jgi:signal transduction histidine kinase
MAEENANLATRVREAASQKTETDEELLMRIARDLHDGPAQDLSLALLRVETLKEGTEAVVNRDPTTEQVRKDFDLVETALTSALKEVREISSDMRLPELADMSLEETIRSAVSDHEGKTGSGATLELGSLCADASLPVKIVVYRVIQEALSNSYRHAPDSGRHVAASCTGGSLELVVSDDGPGFVPGVPLETADRTRLGVRGMRERVEMLGGILEIASSGSEGTRILVRLPVDETS